MKTFKIFLTEQNQVQCDINGICKTIKEYESAGNEEKILSVYKDSKGFDTVGHGHLVTKESPKIFAELNINLLLNIRYLRDFDSSWLNSAILPDIFGGIEI